MNKGIFQKLVGERIFEARKQKGSRGLTQEELAKALGKSLCSVQKYETGDVDIPLTVLYNISEILGVSVSALVDCQQSNTQIDSISDVMAFFIELNQKEQLHFNISVDKSNSGEQTVSITFSDMDIDGQYNFLLCRFFETFKENREALENYNISYETFNAWSEKVISENRLSFLSEKEKEQLSGEELARKRQELFNKKLEQAIAEKIDSKKKEKND